MLERLCSNTAFKIFLIVITTVWLFLYAQTIAIPLQGTHQWRQADTLYTAYFFCKEPTDIMHPKIGPRQLTNGVAIGEFPLYSWVVGKWCQLKGSWDETSPKVINLLITLLMMTAWWAFLKNHFKLIQLQWFHWFALCFYSVISLSFFTIPMPEATALLFFGIAGYFWSVQKSKSSSPVLGSLAFCVGFLLRPYHIPFLVMFKPKLKYFVVTFIACILIFGFWYKYWPQHASDIHGHYGIGFESFGRLFTALPSALSALPQRVLDHTNIIGLLLIPLVFRRHWFLILLYFGSIGMMVVLKATHIYYHAYYLMNAAFIALTIMTCGLESLKKDWQRNLFLMLFVVIGIGNTVHNIRPNADGQEAAEIEALAATIPADAKVTTVMGRNPQYLYWLKRTGWTADEATFKDESSCPEGSDYYLTNLNSHYQLGKCAHGTK